MGNVSSGHVRSHSFKVARRRSLLAAVAATAASLSLVAPAAFATGSGPTVTGVSTSTKTLTPNGGAVLVSATSSGNATCSVVITPTQPGVPAGAACAAGVKISVPVFFTSNTTNAPISFKVTVKACSSGTCVSGAPVTVTEWAYKITFSGVSAQWGTPTSASCPTTSFCMVTDGSSYVYEHSGSTFRRVVLQQGRLIDAVACATTTMCVAGDINGDGFTWNGTSWRKNVTIQILNATEVIATANSSRKAMLTWINDTAAGSAPRNRALIFNGTTWSAPLDFTTPGTTTSVSCLPSLPAAPSTCFAVDNKGYLTTLGGAGGSTSTPVLTTGGLYAISCSVNTCVTGGDGGYVRKFRPGRPTYGNITFASKARVTGASCNSDSSCWVRVGSSIAITGDVNRDGYPDLVAMSSAKDPLTGAIIVVCVPGNSAQMTVVGKSKDMTGHVTLIK